jgi:Tfp pilus assembly protein PilN
MTEQLTEELGENEKQPVLPGPIRIPWAMVPRVNLLPVEILEVRQFRRTKIYLGVGVASALLVAGAGVFWAQQGVHQANDQLFESQTRVAALQADQARYAAVPQIVAQLDAATAARALAMGNDVLWYRYLNDVDGARPADIELNTLTFTLNTGASAAATDPLSAPGLGTIAMAGTAKRYDQVSSWLEALNKITGFSSSSLTSASKIKDVVTFGSGAVITSDALSGRYDKKAG